MAKTACQPIWQGTTLLSQMKPGERCHVLQVDPTIIQSLGNLGIVQDALIKIESVAPFHGPMMIKVGNSQYSLDASMAEKVTVKREIEATIALLGNPNSGKSTIFQALTGLDIETANYAGTTVEVDRAITEHHGRHLALLDLPGTYSLGGESPEEVAVLEALQTQTPDALIVVLDSLNLARNLFLLLQIIEWGFPLSVALNFADLARRRHFSIDEAKLSEILGIPVIKTTATTGKGLDELMHTLDCPGHGLSPQYSNELEEWLQEVSKGGISREAIMKALDGIPNNPEVAQKVATEGDRFFSRYGERPEHRLLRERHGLAGMIASQVQGAQRSTAPLAKPSLRSVIWHWSIHPIIGTILLIGIAAGLMGILFSASGIINNLITVGWERWASPFIGQAVKGLFGQGLLTKSLLWALDSGLLAVLSTGIAYILPFFFLLGLLEDSGYYGSIVFLADRWMHRFGLHGRSMISLLAATGCNVPAILQCRVLPHKRERFIAATLATMVPCTPRIAVIVGGVAASVGWGAGIAVLIAVGLTIVFVGLALNRIMPGESHGVVLETFPLRAPNLLPTLRKTWVNFREFLVLGIPFVVAGCLLLGFLYESGYIWGVEQPLKPLMEGLLGIPTIAGITLIFAFLRKELALQLLLTFAIASGHTGNGILSIMTPKQLIIFALVNTLYIPCIASFGALVKVMGWKSTMAISGITLATALAIGSVANLVLP